MSQYSKDALLAAKRRFLDDDDYRTSRKQSEARRNEDDIRKSHKKKKEKKSKKKKKHKHRSSSDESSSSLDESDGWVEKQAKVEEYKEKERSEDKREDWMGMTGTLATYTRDDIKVKVEKKKKGQIDDYDPSTCSRELNPYWKDGGTGLPSENLKDKDYSNDNRRSYQYKDSSYRSSGFKKPNINDDHRTFSDRRSDRDYSSSTKNWQKKTGDKDYRNKERLTSPSREDRNYSTRERSRSPTEPGTSRHLSTGQKDIAGNVENTRQSEYMTDQQMNALGAKIVKAEIMGNTKLVTQLTTKLQAAREYRKNNPKPPKEDDTVMLTMTDEKGNTRPLTKSAQAGDPRSKGGKKKMETHSAGGDRMRFFADDDKYSLQEMFQNEKYGNAKESQEEFAKIMAKHKNPNDDLEDIFAENITKMKSEAKRDEQEAGRAISQHKTIQRSLENCEYCIDSDRMIKHMMVSLGTKVYVALPTRKSLTEGHCYISTISHVSCSVMADEDVWAEILAYRRALTNMFNSQDEDVVFFEVVSHLHKHPHLVIECVPLPRDVGDTAPIYFKKALLECEAEWSNNKKVVDLKGKDIRRGVPRGLPYFWIDFGMDPGFAHVIEDQQLFPRNFAQEIIGGMLDLHHSLWRKPEREKFEKQMKKVLDFTSIWKQFDIKQSS